MDIKSLKTLEFHKILNIFSKYLQSESTENFVMKIVPVIDEKNLKQMLAETKDAISLYQRKGKPNLAGIRDMSSICSRLKMDANLSNKELLSVRENLYISRNTVNYFDENNQEFLLTQITVRNKLKDLYFNKQLEENIQMCIISEDEMADDASPALRNIRNSIRRKQDNVRDRLNEYIRSAKYSKYIQDNVITIRNGRYVIPVKQENRGNIKGLLHDSSASGATLYIEPMDIVTLNNDIRELESSEKDEMDRIRAELTEGCRPYIDELNCNYKLLTFADLIFAKADMAMDLDYMIPRLNNQKKMRLVNARHPLIDSKEVVPIDFNIGYNFSTLVITGPNTGGKTVSLKTVGLLSAMFQSGFPIPSNEGTEMCIFSNIFADIGDEQSIEQSLSTFSSHMTNIISIIKRCDSGSLVLLDELGAGTDPAEGSALALSLLETLMDKQCSTIATTHYQQIKIYASVTNGIENASCEFDISTLRPTYRLLIGIPGKSNALYISRRLGLDHRIIEKAKGFIDNDNIDYEDVILSLEKSRQRIEKEKTKAIQHSNDFRTKKDNLDKQLKRVEGEKTKILNEARKKASRIIENSRIKADEFLDELNKLKKSGTIKGSAKVEAEFKTKYKQILNDESISNPVITSKHTKYNSSYNPKPGDEVSIIDLNQNATVLNEADKNNEVLVQAGIMKIKIPISNLLYKKSINTNKFSANTYKLDKITKTPALELDIRGLAADEVDLKVGKFIDDSALMAISEISIIHGKGTGILRKAVQSYLKNNPHVKSFRIGNYGEGESGVTVVILK